jgi:hypothetical protein
MWWLNAGIAPVYRDYVMAFEFHATGESKTIRTGADIRKWLPGDAVFEDSLYVPDELKPGSYRLRLALLDGRTLRPAIRLAIEGREPDGWYDLGPITVE